MYKCAMTIGRAGQEVNKYTKGNHLKILKRANQSEEQKALKRMAFYAWNLRLNYVPSPSGRMGGTFSGGS